MLIIFISLLQRKKQKHHQVKNNVEQVTQQLRRVWSPDSEALNFYHDMPIVENLENTKKAQTRKQKLSIILSCRSNYSYFHLWGEGRGRGRDSHTESPGFHPPSHYYGVCVYSILSHPLPSPALPSLGQRHSHLRSLLSCPPPCAPYPTRQFFLLWPFPAPCACLI